MLAHGISTGRLFLIVRMLSDRRHTRLIAKFRPEGPFTVAAFLLITLASIAARHGNGFVSEF
jgi:NADH-quinone oxidoreductase subunit M